MSRHIAVVPVFDDGSHAALRRATELTPHVIAIGFTPDAQSGDTPLLIVDMPNESWTARVERVIATLQRNERPDRITLVLPESLAALFAESAIEIACHPEDPRL